MEWKLGALLLCSVLAAACGAIDSKQPAGDGGEGGSAGLSGGSGGGELVAGAGGDSGASGGAAEGGSAGQGGSAGEGGPAGQGGSAGGGGSAGDGNPDPIDDVPEIPAVDESDLPEPVREAGFIELESVRYQAPFEPQPELRSERARLFYSFTPAEEAAKTKPVFVFFNGGPGGSTTLLLSFGTGPYTLDMTDLSASPAPNPHSFTALGSLLYIDSRQAGFSYGVADNPELEAERERSFASGSFNAAVDAADFARVILRVLERIPAIRNNPVVIVGESYGGTRAAILLDLLLAPRPALTTYVEASFTAELQAHFASVFPGIVPERIGRAARARQFGWQVLIQPLVAGSAQYEAMSSIRSATDERMARELGISLNQLYDRCPYDASRTQESCDELDTAIDRAVTSPSGFETLVGVAPELVPGLAARDRAGAFRFLAADPRIEPEPPELVEVLGVLPSWDRYFSAFADASATDFDRAFLTPFYTGPFLTAARHVNTLITNARLDRVILSDSIVPALNAVVPLQSTPWFAGAEYVYVDADPPTRIRLMYLAHEEFGPAAERLVYMPAFPQSGHSVSVHQPAELFEEVSGFLRDTGLAR